MKTIQLASEFHKAFGARTSITPDVDHGETNALRLELLREELVELSYALALGDKAATLDALTDLQYVLDGAYLALGFAHIGPVHLGKCGVLHCRASWALMENQSIAMTER